MGTNYSTKGGNFSRDTTVCLSTIKMTAFCSEEVINAKILANYFRELCEGFLPPYRDENVHANRRVFESNNKIIYLLSQVERLIKEGKCDGKTFIADILKTKIDHLHLEVLWYLQISNLYTFVEVVQFYENSNNEEVIKRISESIFENILELKGNQSDIRKQMLIDCIRAIFGGSTDNQEIANKEGTFYHVLINLIATDLKKLYESNSNSENFFDKNVNLSLLVQLFNEAHISDAGVKLFIYKNLDVLLQGLPQLMKSIFQKQEKIKAVKNYTVTEFFKLLPKYCECRDLIEYVKNLFMEKPKTIHWDNMIPLLRFLGTNYKEGWSMLKTLSNSFIKDSLQTKDERLLSFGFLIARQGCSEKPTNCFSTYLQWFGSTFSSESKRPINSEEICIFFFNFLSELVPYDSVYYLKVHTNKTPWVPIDCQSILSEYVALVKTRLCDLNVSTEFGICENMTDKSAALYDVENVIKHYERTNEILNSVFQAAMFSRAYFEKKFLVELLSKYEGKKSARHKIIVKLNSLNKIPNALYKSYKTLENKTSKK